MLYNPELIREASDRQLYERSRFLHDVTWYALLANFPVTAYLARRLTRSQINPNYVLRISSLTSTVACSFFVYGLVKMSKAERLIYDKYFSEYDL